MLFIGDVHGKYAQYKKIIKAHPASIQVGDMGVGFLSYSSKGNPRYLSNPPHYAMLPNHLFIRGNHDNPHVCRRHSQWLPDGWMNGEVMFVGGAYSIDRDYRTSGLDWWEEEQLSDEQFADVIGYYIRHKPKVMVTHDCPQDIAPLIHSHHSFDRTRTGNCLQHMWSAHQPELWIHGHHHTSFDQVCNGTRFVCLAELEAREFDVPLKDPKADLTGEREAAEERRKKDLELLLRSI